MEQTEPGWVEQVDTHVAPPPPAVAFKNAMRHPVTSLQDCSLKTTL